jgi:hypothetical protein
VLCRSTIEKKNAKSRGSWKEDLMGCVDGDSYKVISYIDLSKAHISFLYYVCNTLLITLLVIHIYWWVLISRMVIRQLRNCGKVGEDVRSGLSLSSSFSNHYMIADCKYVNF